MKEEAALFKALCDPIRLRLAVLLAIRGEICVCELSGLTFRTSKDVRNVSRGFFSKEEILAKWTEVGVDLEKGGSGEETE